MNFWFYAQLRTDLPHFSPINKAVTFKASTRLGTELYYYEVPITQVLLTTASADEATFQTEPQVPKSRTLYSMNGLLLKPTEYVMNIQESTSDFFTAVENVWTFTIICFTVIVMKLTKYVNLR